MVQEVVHGDFCVEPATLAILKAPFDHELEPRFGADPIEMRDHNRQIFRVDHLEDGLSGAGQRGAAELALNRCGMQCASAGRAKG